VVTQFPKSPPIPLAGEKGARLLWTFPRLMTKLMSFHPPPPLWERHKRGPLPTPQPHFSVGHPCSCTLMGILFALTSQSSFAYPPSQGLQQWDISSSRFGSTTTSSLYWLFFNLLAERSHPSPAQILMPSFAPTNSQCKGVSFIGDLPCYIIPMGGRILQDNTYMFLAHVIIRSTLVLI
jgi:hypothetical protein